MSRFLRIACTKCPSPMPYPSPSPPVTTTFRSGFASFAPVATGIALPWRLWKPYECMNPGRLLEQPIPETTSRSFGSISRLETACTREFRTPKSPHPGHQSGLVSLLYFDTSIISRQDLHCSFHYLIRIDRLSIVFNRLLFSFKPRFCANQAGHLSRVVALH